MLELDEGLIAEDWLLPLALEDAGATEAAEKVAEDDALSDEDAGVEVELPLVAKIPPEFDGTLTDELCVDIPDDVVEDTGVALLSNVDDACVSVVVGVI